MSPIADKEMNDDDIDVNPDAKEDGYVNKPEENKETTSEIQEKGTVLKSNLDEKDKESEDKETEDTADRHVVFTPSRRIRPGTMTEDIILSFPVDISESDSWFQGEDHLNHILSNVDPTTLTTEEAASLAETPQNTDPNVWVYEWLRRLTRDLNLLVVAMLEDSCSSTNCPEMRTLDCQYLCATHDKPRRECPATDYIVHTLDYTTALLNSSKLFPSRVTIQDGPMQYLHSSARRLYRIFIHAFEHHNEVFREFENETGVYTLFLAVAEKHGLVPRELITIPADYKDTAEENNEYVRPPQSGTLFEVDRIPMTNGEID